MKISKAPGPRHEGYDEKNMRINRPMSPHLTIYAPQLTAMLSITHRGMGMAMGGYLTMVGLAAIVMPNTIEHYMEHLENIGWFFHFFIKMSLAFPMCYHYINGIRHLFWDMGQFLTVKNIYSTGYVMVTLTVISSLLLCL